MISDGRGYRADRLAWRPGDNLIRAWGELWRLLLSGSADRTEFDVPESTTCCSEEPLESARARCQDSDSSQPSAPIAKPYRHAMDPPESPLPTAMAEFD